MSTGESSFLDLVESIETVLENNTAPHAESCDCGGSVMTPETEMTNNHYEVSWTEKHSSP